MRFALVVIAASILDLAVFLRIDQWIGYTALFALGYLFVSSAGAGFFAGSRPAVAGGLAVLGGALLSGLVQYAPRATYANDIDVLLGFELQLMTAFIPYAIGGAIAGYAGGRVRRRLVARPTAAPTAEPPAQP